VLLGCAILLVALSVSFVPICQSSRQGNVAESKSKLGTAYSADAGEGTSGAGLGTHSRRNFQPDTAGEVEMLAKVLGASYSNSAAGEIRAGMPGVVETADAGEKLEPALRNLLSGLAVPVSIQFVAPDAMADAGSFTGQHDIENTADICAGLVAASY
jgi:hypothetical protein